MATGPCRVCGVDERGKTGRCLACQRRKNKEKGVRLAGRPCAKCGAADRDLSTGQCRPCQATTRATRGARLADRPCVACGAVDRFPSGNCRPCHAARAARRPVTACVACGSEERFANGVCAPCSRAREKAWRAANPDKQRAKQKRYRASKMGADTEDFTLWDVVARDGVRCSLCGRPVDLTLEGVPSTHPLWRLSPSLEHTVPLSRGGADVLANCTLAHVHCNSGKRDRV